MVGVIRQIHYPLSTVDLLCPIVSRYIPTIYIYIYIYSIIQRPSTHDGVKNCIRHIHIPEFYSPIILRDPHAPYESVPYHKYHLPSRAPLKFNGSIPLKWCSMVDPSTSIISHKNISWNIPTLETFPISWDFWFIDGYNPVNIPAYIPFLIPVSIMPHEAATPQV